MSADGHSALQHLIRKATYRLVLFWCVSITHDKFLHLRLPQWLL